MSKAEALNNCMECIKTWGYISYDGVLDECDEERKLVNYCVNKLNEKVRKGELNNNQWIG